MVIYYFCSRVLSSGVRWAKWSLHHRYILLNQDIHRPHTINFMDFPGKSPLILLLVFFILELWASRAECRSLHRESILLARHERWMAQHGRTYKDAKEKDRRFAIFKSNVEHVESFNSALGKDYKLKINEFADLTNEEFRAFRNGFRRTKAKMGSTKDDTSFRYENFTDVPSFMDWREKGAVTPVKSQGHCSSCWAFSAVAAVEGLIKITTGKLISLSEQELVDCDVGGNNHGCEYGLMDNAFEFIQQNNGLATEAEYPYNGSRGACRAVTSLDHTVKIGGYEDVPMNDEGALLKAVANQPVSVAVDSDGDFQFYSSGVFTGGCGTDFDHAVTIVGYGTSANGIKYWLVKNSWGTGWGEEGYVRIQREVDTKEGLCGIAVLASYPVA
ncbi:senescence-specific cysteine protease SAG39-like [Rhodamnia argentea]|uniref:Senescence-specific cysteine protease SAG39-like n=1 Tax=Rhodamnia argentea TaxID=178133 RepID=A0A8B8QJF9_9MYRT|nr:senescence-specific cysteine protease SAG39-like [Rhodamnia argentea]